MLITHFTKKIDMFKKVKEGIERLRDSIRVDFVAFGIILLYIILNLIMKFYP